MCRWSGLLKSADESSKETIREAIKEQDLRCLGQRKLKAHLTGSLRESKIVIAHFEELARRRGFKRVDRER